MIRLSEYDLADAELIASCRKTAAASDFGPQPEHHVIQYVYSRTAVVIGASNKPETSVRQDACLQDGIAVMQRPSGGEAVLISPATLLFSHIMLGSALPQSKDFFMQNLGYFEAALGNLGVQNLSFNGISDLCIGQKKILGCAIYRRPVWCCFRLSSIYRKIPRGSRNIWLSQPGCQTTERVVLIKTLSLPWPAKLIISARMIWIFRP